MDIKDVLLIGEEYENISDGKCSNCGRRYIRISGSTKTVRRDKNRYVDPEEKEKGWCSFRCKNCKKLIEETWEDCTNIQQLITPDNSNCR